MEQLWIRFLATLLAAWIGGCIGRVIRLPTPRMVGGLIAVCVFNGITGLAFFPRQLRTVLMIGSGAMLGLQIKRENVKGLKRLPGPVMISSICLVILTCVFGLLIHYCSGIDLKTALYASTPGGMTDMTLIALEQGADSGVVIVLHLVRYLTAVTLLPICVRAAIRKFTLIKQDGRTLTEEPRKNGEKLSPLRVLVTLAVAVAGGLLGTWLAIPSGTLAFSLLFTAVYHVLTNRGQIPEKTPKVIQFFCGAYIGAGIDTSFVNRLDSLLIAVALMIVIVLIWSFGVAYLIFRLTGLDFPTAVMASSPGGTQEMSLMAMEYEGVDVGVVAIMQLLRILVSVSVMPTCILLLSNLMN